MSGRPWQAPELWPGGECFVLGGGPSLAEVDLTRLEDRRVIGVNDAYQLGDWVDVLFFGDEAWGERHEEALRGFAGLKVTAPPELDREVPLGVKVLERRGRPFGICEDPRALTWNLNSGACAIGLAAHFGVKRIVLLGFDMKRIGGRNNWHEENIRLPGKSAYTRFLGPFPAIAADLDARGIECVNATPGSDLTVFPIVEPSEVLR